MDILDKIKLNQHTRDNSSSDAQAPQQSPDSATAENAEFPNSWRELGFERRRNRYGYYWLRRYPLGEAEVAEASRVEHALGHSLGQGLRDFQRWHRHPESMAFVDIETTGLQMGAGNVVFLIGWAWYNRRKSARGWEVVQLFLHEYAEERAMLYALDRMLRGFRTLVSFNGHTFDLPMLSSRMNFVQWDSPFLSLPHLDLYPLSRRLFRGQGRRFSLQALERDVLHFARPDDIPGKDIPAAFFAYQSRGETTELARVVKHHVWDIHSLISLFHAIVNTALQESLPSVLLNLFYWSAMQRDWSLARRLLQLQPDYPFARAQQVLSFVRSGMRDELVHKGRTFVGYVKALARFYEREDRPLAAELWRAVGQQDYEAAYRLSRYCETAENDGQEAIYWTEQARELFLRNSRSDKQRFAELMDKRLKRLRQKQASSQGNISKFSNYTKAPLFARDPQ